MSVRKLRKVASMFRKSLFTILLSSIVLGGCGKGEVIETEEQVVGTEEIAEGQNIETISGQSNQVSVSDAQMALKNYIIQKNLSQKFVDFEKQEQRSKYWMSY